MPAPIDIEAGRISALRRYQILDTAPEAAFDKVTQLATELFELPMAGISLIDADRQWFKAFCGFNESEMPNSAAFCTQTIRVGTVLAIEDATKDPRFADNPLVTSSPGLRCYMGAPLTSPDGYQIGAVCIAGTKPRVFSERDCRILLRLAELVMAQLDLRLASLVQTTTERLERADFSFALAESFAEFQRTGHPATVAIIAIDDIAPTGKSLGGFTAKDAREAIAGEISRVLRKSDAISNWDGNQVAVLLSGADLLSALDVLERLRLAIRTVTLRDRTGASIVVNIGFVACRKEFANFQSWSKAAEASLRKARAAGKNQIRTLEM